MKVYEMIPPDDRDSSGMHYFRWFLCRSFLNGYRGFTWFDAGGNVAFEYIGGEEDWTWDHEICSGSIIHSPLSFQDFVNPILDLVMERQEDRTWESRSYCLEVRFGSEAAAVLEITSLHDPDGLREVSVAIASCDREQIVTLIDSDEDRFLWPSEACLSLTPEGDVSYLKLPRHNGPLKKSVQWLMAMLRKVRHVTAVYERGPDRG